MRRHVIACSLVAIVFLTALPRISRSDPTARCIHTMTNCPGRGWVKSSCDDPDPCGLGGGGGGGGGYDAGATGAAIGQALGNAIVQGIKQAQERARIQAEQARQEAAARAAWEQQQEVERQRLFEQQKMALLGATGAVGSGGLQARDTAADDSAAAQQNWLMRLHQREMDQRRAALERLKGSPDETWCKLNLIHVRMPTPPENDVAGQYPGMVQSYLEHRDAWDQRCGGPSAQPGYRDNDSQLMALRRRSPAPAAPALAPAPAPAPVAVAAPADTAVVDLSGVKAEQAVASLKDGRAPAENLVNWGPPETLQLSLSTQREAVAPEATSYIQNALDTLFEQGREAVAGTVKDAAGASLGLTGVVMVNAAELPQLILPNIEAAARGELSVGEADRLLPRAVNTLYNTGSLSNEVAEAALSHPDAMSGVQVWGSDKARGAVVDTVSDGIAELARLPEGTAALLSKQVEGAINHWTATDAGASR